MLNLSSSKRLLVSWLLYLIGMVVLTFDKTMKLTVVDLSNSVSTSGKPLLWPQISLWGTMIFGCVEFVLVLILIANLITLGVTSETVPKLSRMASAGIFLLVSYSLFRLVNAADLAWLFVIAGFQLNIETTTHFLTVERFRNNQRLAV